jgi:hypothetical protein
VNRRLIGAGVAVALTLGVAAPAGASKRPTFPTAPTCRAVNFKGGVHRAAVAREQMLTSLVSALQSRADTYGLNGAQVGALQSANSSLAALDSHIASTCYATFAEFKSDAAKVWDDYRVYWLRVPQTHVIGAADHLGKVLDRLDGIAEKLSKYAETNAQSKADYLALTGDLGQVAGTLGASQKPASVITAAAHLAPAQDMTADDAALEAAHAVLATARAALVVARADAYKMVGDLKA